MYGFYMLYLVPKTGGYFGDIVGMLMLIISGASVVITSILQVVAKRYSLPDKWYGRLAMGLLGILLSYFFLWLYVQTQNTR